jgi:ferredoxin
MVIAVSYRYMEVRMTYRVIERCLKCGLCLGKCPEGAIIAGEEIEEMNGFILRPVSIDPEKCTDCGICVSEEYWCPAQAIVKA